MKNYQLCQSRQSCIDNPKEIGGEMTYKQVVVSTILMLSVLMLSGCRSQRRAVRTNEAKPMALVGIEEVNSMASLGNENFKPRWVAVISKGLGLKLIVAEMKSEASRYKQVLDVVVYRLPQDKGEYIGYLQVTGARGAAGGKARLGSWISRYDTAGPGPDPKNTERVLVKLRKKEAKIQGKYGKYWSYFMATEGGATPDHIGIVFWRP